MASTGDNSKQALVEGLNGLLADHFALYIKTKNFHWHVKGPRFRDLHLLFDEQAVQIQGQIDIIAERVRKNDAKTLTSLSSIMAATSVAEENSTEVDADAMVKQLHDDNAALVASLKALKEAADKAGDNATDGLIDDWTDMAEERVWFLKSFLG
ncbi:DNA starvation/stationary phase protection protein [Aurantiacibacter xanthus]|uniref:DNA starvation/stationary phase protection protein n=1 Tax=Aurantiacibacter xanthus TaxID=1784712 RepID=A0A3A1PHN9_9SPHN|nr:DNA starvation/stationary phase protection protein [Aurantiacibacter xanthus]RIV93323.1 DNA starvation/stationary phase protection protein [Aurantiacibacter xanthus]